MFAGALDKLASRSMEGWPGNEPVNDERVVKIHTSGGFRKYSRFYVNFFMELFVVDSYVFLVLSINN